jgi:hypothetical protein
MRHTILALILLLAGVTGAHAQAVNCVEFPIVASMATPVPLTAHKLAPWTGPITVWLKINDAGDNTPYVDAAVVGPDGASCKLCTLDATNTLCTHNGPIPAISFSPSDCTGACSLTASVCGMNQSGIQ